MNGYQYEHQCAKSLRKKGFYNVKVTKGSGDQGIDIIAYKRGKKYGIQCKYYTYPVGNKAVQEAFAGAKFYDCKKSVVLTNNTFTKSAKELAEKIGVDLWEKNKIPFTAAKFNLIKYIGFLLCLLGIMGFMAKGEFDYFQFSVLQQIELMTLFTGGLFLIFDFDQWMLTFLSGVFYTASFLAYFISDIMLNEGTFVGPVFYFLIIALSFFRAYCLKSKITELKWGNKRFKRVFHKNMRTQVRKRT